MAARVTEGEVRQLLEGVGSSVSLQIFIDQATMLVDEELTGLGFSNTRLKMLELNLAAHYAVVALEHGGFSYQKIGDSQEGYQKVEGSAKGFEATRFGQQALSLDTAGVLSNMGNAIKAEFKVISPVPNPYYDVVNR